LSVYGSSELGAYTDTEPPYDWDHESCDDEKYFAIPSTSIQNDLPSVTSRVKNTHSKPDPKLMEQIKQR